METKDEIIKSKKLYAKVYRQNNKEKIRKLNKLWNIANAEKVKTYAKQYRTVNSKKIKLLQQRWKESDPINKEKIRSWKRDWARKNREKVYAGNKKWKITNKDKHREIQRRKEKKAVVQLSDKYIIKLIKRYTKLTAKEVREFPNLMSLVRSDIMLKRELKHK